MEPIREVRIEESREAQTVLRSQTGVCLRTPLVRLNWTPDDGSPAAGVEIWLKLECLQPVVNSFKVRGAGNACAKLGATPEEVLRRGVVTASAGNMAQGLAVQARRMGCACTAVVPDSAPQAKLDAIKRLGGSVIKVPFNEWWEVISTGFCPQSPDGFFVHPVADQRVLAGNSTIALEIVEDLPDVDAILVPYGGGALACGIASVIKAIRPECDVFGVEPETAAPLAKSFAEGAPRGVAYEATFVDGCGGKDVLQSMWPLAQRVLRGGLKVPLDAVCDAIRVMAERNKVVSEGAGACPVAAAMLGLAGRKKKIVCVVSGGGLDTAKLLQILARCPRAAHNPKPSAAARQCPVSTKPSAAARQCPVSRRNSVLVGVLMGTALGAASVAVASWLRRRR